MQHMADENDYTDEPLSVDQAPVADAPQYADEAHYGDDLPYQDDQGYDDEPTTERVSVVAATRARVAAASRSRLGGAMRASFGHEPGKPARQKPPLRIRRARRLVALGVVALVTLMIAIVSGGAFIAVNLIADIGLFLYLRHLRNVARAQRAKVARERRARIARQEWERVSAQERSSQLDGWSAPEFETETVAYSAVDEAEYAPADDVVDADLGYEMPDTDATADIDLSKAEQPAMIDLTDAPTEELVAAKAS